MKFGGTSLGSPQRFGNVAEIVSKKGSCFVVVSAMSGTNNALVAIADKLTKGDKRKAIEDISSLYNIYTKHTQELFGEGTDLYEECIEIVNKHFAQLSANCQTCCEKTSERNSLVDGSSVPDSLTSRVRHMIYKQYN